MELILLAAGASTRFNTVKPKYLLPINGKLMFEAAIEPFINQVNAVHIVIQQAHQDLYNVSSLTEHNVICLPGLTSGPAESAALACSTFKDRSVFIKDCDSFFTANITSGDFVCVTNWRDNDASKGYVEHADTVIKLHEKQPVGTTISVGGYGFASSADYVNACNNINNTGEFYISAVVNKLLTSQTFTPLYVNEYKDVGTQAAYEQAI